MQSKCKSLADKAIRLDENWYSFEQCGRSNNSSSSGIPNCVADNALDATIASMPTDIDVAVDSNSVEACHRFRKPERAYKSRKTTVRFSNQKYWKKILNESQKSSLYYWCKIQIKH